MSIWSDVAGTVDDHRKGITPKEKGTCCFFLGHVVNNYMTVIWSVGCREMGRYRNSYNTIMNFRADISYVGSFYCFIYRFIE